MTTRIVHLSDLHFGRDRPELAEPLIAAVGELAPDLVAVSGDLTQRARIGQFRAARAFLERLPAPVLCVPGNHDTPLDNLFVRLLRPFGRYREHISQDLEPRLNVGDVAVVGANTVNPLAWQRGRIGPRTVDRVCAAFRARGDSGPNVVVLHHPLEHAPGTDKALTRGAGRALAAFGACGAHVVLCGHLHSWRTAAATVARGTLLVQAGTSLSTRVRDEPNDFNLITLDGRAARVDRYTARDNATGFAHEGAYRFMRSDAGWEIDARR
ncbi:metallophosphoesterase [Rhodovulum sp. 12E13]|uniref:metallophosphoesterase family protein n=1 Tax=Rhodovulum sp. 12E13 TaxID=2203891 RepID=UPI000E1A74AB|nr:metallophosphoesterase family protein [Rhodovulum sp. 12E13]RDC73965.1 metallophosphoesterase [Rhodovulum sp. 12E13]